MLGVLVGVWLAVAVSLGGMGVWLCVAVLAATAALPQPHSRTGTRRKMWRRGIIDCENGMANARLYSN